jgi:pimeloyl-ACP methyl ester carboxylesterase
MIEGLRFITVAAIIALLPGATYPVRAESHLAQRSNSTVEVLVDGAGPLVLTLGRGAEDFEELSRALVAAGYRAARLQPRGVGSSGGKTEGLTLRDLADDAAAGIEAAGGGPAVVVGHAFGQRVARMAAVTHPGLVRALVMIAAGGKVLPTPAIASALSAVFDETLTEAQHLEAVRVAFFAPGNDPAVWRRGWYPATARIELRAAEIDLNANSQPSADDWWNPGGSAPILVIQGLQDQLSVPENGRMLKAEGRDRVELIELDGAGHALLPEKPAEISEAVTTFLRKVAGPSR